ncbi:MAG: chlororespiratory reduction protein 7 [Geitlerinemataceae cyanobacterium]
MSESLYSEDHFVVLETHQSEQILTAAELLDKLQNLLATRQTQLPRDLQSFTSVEDQARYLMETACDFDLAPGEYLQWYAIRLEK